MPVFANPSDGYTKPAQRGYRGRFAPSPSGRLHLGSLVSALASYLDAKAHQGEWLLRIEDVDTPRVKADAIPTIIDSVAAHGMIPDAPVVFQSQRLGRYREVLEQLISEQHTYQCDCTRKAIKSRGTGYDGHCRDRNLQGDIDTDWVVRLKLPESLCHVPMHDPWLGQLPYPEPMEDIALYRRDNVYTYHLAVFVDDHDFGITDIVRGADIASLSYYQRHLYALSDGTAPKCKHHPLVYHDNGQKYSKQHHSPEIDDKQALRNLKFALQFLVSQSSLKPENPATQHELACVQTVDEFYDFAVPLWQDYYP